MNCEPHNDLHTEECIKGFLRGVCSTCQQSGIELIYEDEHTVLQEHEAFGKHCNGSYDFPETTYREKE